MPQCFIANSLTPYPQSRDAIASKNLWEGFEKIGNLQNVLIFFPASSTATASDHHHTATIYEIGHNGVYGSMATRDVGSNRKEESVTTSDASIVVTVDSTCNLDSQVSNMGGVDGDTGDETRPANMRVIYIIRVF